MADLPILRFKQCPTKAITAWVCCDSDGLIQMWTGHRKRLKYDTDRYTPGWELSRKAREGRRGRWIEAMGRDGWEADELDGPVPAPGECVRMTVMVPQETTNGD